MLSAVRPGAVLGNYELVRPIGSGGMGVVYEARHRALQRRVALKVLHARAPTEGRLAKIRFERFLREGRAAAQVHHPHIVDVFDFGVEDGTPYLVMELVEGETLHARLARDRAIPLRDAVDLLLPILSAVGELHAAGIVHRDLKPANILLTRGRDGAVVPKLADFGVSRIDGDVEAMTESGIVLGTLEFMAPEQTRATREASELSDQYAMAVVLYRCVTGAMPFTGDAPYDLMRSIVNDAWRLPSEITESLPAALDAVVARAMSRDPRARFHSVEALGEALLPFASAEASARWGREFCFSNIVLAASGAKNAVVPLGRTEAFDVRPRLPRALLVLALFFAIAVASFSLGRVRRGDAAPRDEAPRPRSVAAGSIEAEPVTTPPRVAPTSTSEPPAAAPVTLRAVGSAMRAPPPHRTARGASDAGAPPRIREIGDNGAPILDLE